MDRPGSQASIAHRRQTPDRSRPQRFRFGRILGGLCWPCPGHPALRLVDPRRTSIQTRQQGAQARIVPIRLRGPRETPSRWPITRARSSIRQAPQPGATTRRLSRWHAAAVTSCSPCCATAPFTNPSQLLTLDERHSPPLPQRIAIGASEFEATRSRDSPSRFRTTKTRPEPVRRGFPVTAKYSLTAKIRAHILNMFLPVPCGEDERERGVARPATDRQVNFHLLGKR